MTQLHDRTTGGIGTGHLARGELIGRETEMAQVTAALTAARQGRGGAVLVTGEPGIGKTRLAAEALAAAARAQMVTAHGRPGTMDPRVPYRPLVEALLLLSRAGRLPEPGELGRYEAVLGHLMSGTRAAGAGDVSPLMVAETVLRLTAVLGRERGCLLVLDDLHDADAGTLAVVEYLLDHIGQQPAVLLLVAGRGPCAAAELAARARRLGAATVLDLRPLSRSEVRLLVAAELGAGASEAGAEPARRAADHGAGIPFVVKELVHGLAGHPPGDGPTPPVPAAVVDDIRRRTAKLGPFGVELLGTAALFGPRFPSAALRHVTGRDLAEVSVTLHAAVAACLIVPDPSSPQWYAFRYPLAAQALLDGLAPGERGRYARRAARTVADLHPGLPGTWCAQAAELYAHAGETRAAVRLYCEAAQRAMAEGTVDRAAERAVELLVRAHRLAGSGAEPAAHAAVLEQLLDAVTCSGRLDLLPAPVTGPEALGADPAVPAGRRAAIHARLARIATLGGRPAEALGHLDTARWLLGDHPDPAPAALVDLAAAHVELCRFAPDRLSTAAALARRAADAARHAGLPAVEGEALLVLGELARERDEPAALDHLARARALAHEHRLPALRISADVHLARIAAERDGRPARLERARQEALRTGALPQALETGFVLALEDVRRCEFGAARDRIRAAAAEAAGLGLGRTLALLRLAEAVRCAHQGRRAEMREALDALAPHLDDAPGVRSMAYGTARAFCSLLEERHEAAEQEFARALAYDAENPSTGDFGQHGVILLLGVLAGRMGRRHHAEVAETSAGGTRWNRPFVGLAHAVLLGREGRTAEATAAARAALEAAEPYPMARHLCLRLVARTAHTDGWGVPADWLREAEEYFHGAGLPAAAGACRALLRGMGAPVRQRRTGTEQVPAVLRRCGITAREFEVARLLAERIGNKDIAGRLHISPRTVEKHVASLLQKTGHPNRSAFASAARDLVTGTGTGTPVPV
ncbi:helix-turn-helix transcriptional regulator [Streptomyces subrutilus]|uniref:helix-turn-helix transcriptional regulator n=1 Tax=Streptomyces subrutilus TaxID=36818 RepID=UPI00340B0672